jgi:membrane associated rhomboid family serine protease
MAYRGFSGFGFGSGLTPWVKRLLIANGAVSLLTFVARPAFEYLAFVPSLILVRPWTILTYMFVHGDIWHLLFNMLTLFFFGPPLESRWGSREFIRFYFVAGLGGALLSFLFAPASTIVGASAAIYGVLLAFAMVWPDLRIYFWGIFPIKAKWLVAGLVAISLLSAFGSTGRGIAHFAHLGGLAAAFLYMKFDGPLASARLSRLKRRITRPRLTVVSGSAAPKRPEPPRRVLRSEEEEALLDRVDRVLDKISSSGMASLTPEEKRVLDEVSRRYRRD